jgi:hypothetical protein
MILRRTCANNSDPEAESQRRRSLFRTTYDYVGSPQVTWSWGRSLSIYSRHASWARVYCWWVSTGIYLHLCLNPANVYLPLVSPVFWFTSVELGGYGFSPMQISMFIASIGVSQATWLLLVFPPLQHRIGTGGVLRLCLIAWPIFFVSAPLCNVFLRHNWTVAFWTVAPVCQVAGSGVAMAFSESLPK